MKRLDMFTMGPKGCPKGCPAMTNRRASAILDMVIEMGRAEKQQKPIKPLTSSTEHGLLNR